MAQQQGQSSSRGFAAMDQKQQRAIASMGGKAAHEKGTAHEFSSEEARAAGRKGGAAVSRNREHMAAIGRKGGAAVSQNRGHMAQIGRKGGEARGDGSSGASAAQGEGDRELSDSHEQHAKAGQQSHEAN
ncbi:KGG domain-containing protein [Sorangium sp. So ce1078]|uniref:KGG domain-containing protein n=1 Tax=Sorangium sp. So ce1078 TaxID=3133329 RepID=UPI003F60E291